MIIECPSCGFTGRVPSNVAAAPHHARCPKCQLRFNLGELVARVPEAVDAGSRPDLRHDMTRPRLDPSSSSYEIEALTDDFSSDDDDERGAVDDWDDDWDDPIEPDEDAPSQATAVRSVRLPGFLLKEEESTRQSMIGRDRATSPDATPWRFRLFQGWAILFIIWAALIGTRGILATIDGDQDFLFSAATIWPVAAVVLLVTASAGLFLLIDLSRWFAAPTGSTAGAVLSPPASVSPRHNGSIDPTMIRPRRQSTG